jgi:dephospho-CoA kinase
VSNLPNIAVIGRMGAGKSKAASMLVEHFHYGHLAFAGEHPGGVRDVAVRLWGPEAHNDRAKLQAIGMLGREHDADVWVRNAMNQLTKDNRLPGAQPSDEASGPYFVDLPVVVDDMRFPNEQWSLRGRGFITVYVRANRNLRLKRLLANGKLTDEAQLDHVSEQQIDTLIRDHEVTNESSGIDLFNQLAEVIKRETR